MRGKRKVKVLEIPGKSRIMMATGNTGSISGFFKVWYHFRNVSEFWMLERTNILTSR